MEAGGQVQGSTSRKGAHEQDSQGSSGWGHFAAQACPFLGFHIHERF